MKRIYLIPDYLTNSQRATAGRLSRYGIVALSGLLLASCSGLKYIPEGQKLYTGSKVTIDAPTKLRNQAALQTELETVVRPKPNASILGQRPKLYFWHLGLGKEKGLKHFLANKLGEAPVLLSQVQAKQTRTLMTNRLQNRGYFHGSVSSEVKEQEKTAQVDYTARPGQQYLIQDLRFPQGDSALVTAIRNTQAGTLLKAGERYDLDVFTNERVRIDQALKNEGFYYFNPNYLLFQVDSTLQGKVNVYYKLKPETPARAKQPYWLNTISLNTNYVLTDTTRRNPVVFQK